MQVQSLLAGGAVRCAGYGAGEPALDVEAALLDSPPRVGDWLLVHVGVAVRALSELEARQISDALEAVTAAAAGRPFEHLLADLIDREPELPPHLQPQHPGGTEFG